MDMNDATAKAIAAERAIANLTVKRLAEISGIPERSLMRVLQAERDIKVTQVAQIATALGIAPHEIIARAEEILARPVVRHLSVVGDSRDQSEMSVADESLELRVAKAGDPREEQDGRAD